MAPQTKSSIAGRAHGAKPKAQEPNQKRYYPQLRDIPGIHPELERAMISAYDYIHETQQNVRALQAQVAALTAAGASGGTAKGNAGGSADAKNGGKPAVPFNDNIQGIKVAAATDPTQLKSGWTLRYSTESGQFEFGP